MRSLIEMDEYALLAEIDGDGIVTVIAGNIGLDDGTIRNMTDEECEAAEKKHQCLIEEILLAKRKKAQDDDRADAAIENYINSREIA